MAERISIQFSRFSAFYSPLIATIAGGFLAEEGFAPEHSVAPVGKSAIAGLVDGSVHVAQSAISQGFMSLEKGETPPVVHFAQINERDGFFIAARNPDPHFTWAKLHGGRVLADHGGQPLAMFRYACKCAGLDLSRMTIVDAGINTMEARFRAGEGDYIHLQGPGPQQLQHDGVGHVVASVGATFGPVAFSSLAARREWLKSEQAPRFMRAYRKARAWVRTTPAAEIAAREAPFFPGVAREVLTATIDAYQKLGCWTPHVEITRPAFEVALDVFENAKLVTRRHRYDDIIVPPPA
ncbi:MAG TPA: ABC transporter substrate-binding protein [Hyphomicrobiaceae bacterium]|nr:ABC transporter substrate-binding protein [Hyphomicrobiaceae bacterium]